MNTALPAYYHPTTVCFVDDNHSFLRSLSIDMPDDLPYISFLTPEEALEEVNQPQPLPPLAERCFSMDISSREPVVEFNMGALEQEIKQISRFQRLSVLLVDYAMPTMDGLEFCAEVRDRDVQIALLTGVADEKTAVAAFNAGLIDRYIPKSALSTRPGLMPHLESLKNAYFSQFSARLNDILALDPPRFMTEAAFADRFGQIVAEQRIVEYYLTRDPWGYLMLRADGSLVRLVVVSPEEQAAHIAIAHAHDAPPDIQADLVSGSLLLQGYEHPEDYLGHEPYPWKENVLPAERVTGNVVWLVGIDEAPPMDIDFDPAQSSFNKFLQQRRPVV